MKKPIGCQKGVRPKNSVRDLRGEGGVASA